VLSSQKICCVVLPWVQSSSAQPYFVYSCKLLAIVFSNTFYPLHSTPMSVMFCLIAKQVRKSWSTWRKFQTWKFTHEATLTWNCARAGSSKASALTGKIKWFLKTICIWTKRTKCSQSFLKTMLVSILQDESVGW